MERFAAIIEPGYADYSHERSVLGPRGIEVRPCHWNGDRQKLAEQLREAEIVFVRDTVVDAALINGMQRARGIVRYGIGVDSIDLEAARSKGIIIARVADYGADIEVADHAVALILAVKRRLLSRDRSVRRGAWQIGQQEPIKRIADATLGLLGYGRIARAVAARMRTFGIRTVIAYDPYLEQAEDVELVGLEELARRSDILSLHAPGSAQSARIIDAQFLAAMPQQAVIVNTARGTLIDESALHEALVRGRLQGAGLDVFAVEPPVGNPLLELDNVVVSDHCGWYSESTVAAIQEAATEQARQIIETGTASERVN